MYIRQGSDTREVVLRRLWYTPDLRVDIVFSEACEVYEHGYDITFDATRGRVLTVSRPTKQRQYSVPLFMSESMLGLMRCTPVSDPKSQCHYLQLMRQLGQSSVHLIGRRHFNPIDAPQAFAGGISHNAWSSQAGSGVPIQPSAVQFGQQPRQSAGATFGSPSTAHRTRGNQEWRPPGVAVVGQRSTANRRAHARARARAQAMRALIARRNAHSGGGSTTVSRTSSGTQHQGSRPASRLHDALSRRNTQ